MSENRSALERYQSLIRQAEFLEGIVTSDRGGMSFWGETHKQTAMACVDENSDVSKFTHRMDQETLRAIHLSRSNGFTVIWADSAKLIRNWSAAERERLEKQSAELSRILQELRNV